VSVKYPIRLFTKLMLNVSHNTELWRFPTRGMDETTSCYGSCFQVCWTECV